MTTIASRLVPIERELMQLVETLSQFDIVLHNGVEFEAKIVKQMVVDVVAKIFQITQSLNIKDNENK